MQMIKDSMEEKKDEKKKPLSKTNTEECFTNAPVKRNYFVFNRKTIFMFTFE